MGRSSELNVFARPTGPDHPDRWSIQQLVCCRPSWAPPLLYGVGAPSSTTTVAPRAASRSVVDHCCPGVPATAPFRVSALARTASVSRPSP
ncbi:hypothetical protein [Streptomyces roseolilacinus]|uniref:hypothetical protein n=1 Tax=Streptomyces roseolilacinus TaxID=66904 RepID=UPI00382C13F2